MRTRTALPILFALSAFILTGCGTFNLGQKLGLEPDLSKIQPPSGKPILTLEGEGVQVFRCAADAKGTYWRFEQPQANLFDKHGELLVKHSGPMQAFEHIDGSEILSCRITSWVNPSNPEKDLKLALYRCVADPGKSTLNGVKYVQRQKTSGGQPQGSCSQNEVGNLLKVPFKAEFVFWK